MLSFEKSYNPVVYLSAEFAIDSDLPTYAGGLGVLAGDIIKQAADEDREMIGIGILYKGKRFNQHITADGKEEKRDSEFDHDTTFLRPTTGKTGQPLVIELSLGNQQVLIKSYHVRLSDKTILIFLSTDVDGNAPHWREDVAALYRGDEDSQIRQQIILGIGGYKILSALSIKPKLYHFNEGRPIFLFWELMAECAQKGLSFPDAFAASQKQVVYTNHTLVDAANLHYPAAKILPFAQSYADLFSISPETFIESGVDNGDFSITKYALSVSFKQSAVSKLHGELSQKQWPDKKWLSITNGIHMPSWQDSDFRKTNSDNQVWELHMQKKRELERSVVERTGYGYDPTRLTITWARRLAEYKQPLALFEDIARLKKIVSTAGKEVQILYAGNAHGEDPRTKSIIERLIQIASTDLLGHVIFIPNYNTSLANHLVSGSDVWLNTPIYGLEASGTSGMKALSNGVLNATVADGWAHEVNWEGIGWTFNSEHIAEQIYTTLENEILPLYFSRNQDGIPVQWIAMMRKSIETSEHFSTKRTLEEYYNLLYA